MSRAAIDVFLASWLVAYVLSSLVPVTVVHVVIDDLGMHDMGYRNHQTRTPTFDSMVRDGMDIPEFYCYKSCSPSRASLLTGRYPFRLGYHHQQGAANVVPLNFTMLPALLKPLGWRTHALGKWHVGHARRHYTPTYRGFDTFFGHFGILSNYWDHTSAEAGRCKVNGTVDFVDAYHGGSVQPAELSITRGQYASRVLSDRAVRIITDHAKHHRSKSLYIYLATPNVHTPLQAPCETCLHYPRTSSDSRRVADAMLEEVDSGVGLIKHALATADMLPRAVFIVHTDNGGELTHAVNMPFRGSKFGFWEGGLRGPAFIWSPLLPSSQRGSALRGMAHISDFYSTIVVGIAGAPSWSLNDTGPLTCDSHNLWPAIMGQSSSNPRSEVVHYPLLDSAKQGVIGNRCAGQPHMVCRDQASKTGRCVALVGCAPSMRRGRFKLLLGWPGLDWLSFLPPLATNSSAFGHTGGRRLPDNDQHCQANLWRSSTHCDTRGQASNCSLSSPCLFDVTIDPSETYNRAHLFPEIVAELTKRLQTEALASIGAENTLPLKSDEEGQCQVMQDTGYLLPVDWDGGGPGGGGGGGDADRKSVIPLVPSPVIHDVETRPKAAFFVHTPKAAGSFILAAFDTCNITFSCERSLGPAGVLIADPVQVGAASPDTWSAMCYDGVNASSSQAQEQYHSHAQQPLIDGSCAEWQQPQLGLGLGTRPSALHPLDEQSEKSTQWSARAPNTSFCRGVRHFPLQITLRFHAMLSAAGYTPIVLAGVRHPFTWHISMYSWGLQNLVKRVPASAWQRHGSDYEPQDAACVRWDLQLNVSAGRACAVQFRRYIYEKAQKLHRQTRSTEGRLSSIMTRMYGRNWSLVQDWAWIRTELLEEDLERVYERVTGLRFPLSGQCNLTRLSAESIALNSGADNIARLAAYDGNVHQGVTHLNLPPMETLYDQPALELILAGEDQVFKRFFYSTTLEDASQHQYFTTRAGEI